MQRVVYIIKINGKPDSECVLLEAHFIYGTLLRNVVIAHYS